MRNTIYVDNEGTGTPGSSEEIPLAKPVTDFQYLIDTYHLDDEDGLMYKVLRVGKHRGYIVAWRQLVLTDGTLDKESKRPVHIKNVEELADLTGDTLPNNSPLLPIDVANTG